MFHCGALSYVPRRNFIISSIDTAWTVKSMDSFKWQQLQPLNLTYTILWFICAVATVKCDLFEENFPQQLLKKQ